MPYIERLPLIFDHHNHLSLSAMLSSYPYVGQYTSKEDVLSYVRNQVGSDDVLTVVTGLHHEAIKLTETDLDSLPPLVFLNNCLHGYTCNAKAADMLRKEHIEPYPRTAKQAEKEMAKLFFFLSASPTLCPSAEHLAPAFKRCVNSWHQAGLYGAEDMMYTLPYACDAKLCGDFKVKTRRPWRESDSLEKEQNAPISSATERIRLKLFADGALGAGTAAISEGYVKDGHPVLIYEDDELASILRKCIAWKADTAIHTIGDTAIAQVLRVLQRCGSKPANCRFKLRLEHCQFITLKQAQECKQLGITLCMQPNFSHDSLVYAHKLSPICCRRNNPLRMLIDQVGFLPGKDLLWGSDGMPSGLAPALQNALFPPQPEQALTIEEVLSGYSADSVFGYQEYIIDEERQSVVLKQ